MSMSHTCLFTGKNVTAGKVAFFIKH